VFCRFDLYGFGTVKPGLRWYDSFLILLFFYLFILQIQAIWSFTIDDMYISLRYAKHWASGAGLLWNVNAPPVEGYSNFSFVVLGALTLLLKGNPIIVLKIAGLIGLFFTCCFIYLISRFWFARRESIFQCLCLLLYKGQIIWATSGLETTLYEAFISGAVYCCFRGMGYQLSFGVRKKPEFSYFVASGLLLSLAGMTRPEAPGLMILFFVLMCWDRPKVESQKYWQGIFLFCLTLALIYLPYFFWRIYYYGFLLPNSVYCKGLSGDLTLLLDIHYLKLIWPFAILCLPACLQSEDKRHYFLWLPSLIYLMMLVDSDPVVAFDNRLFLSAFVLLLPLVLQGISVIIYGFWGIKDYVFGLLFYLSCFVFAVFCIPKMSLSDYRYFTENPLRGEQLRGRLVDWLGHHTSAGSSVVLADSGQIPYNVDLNFIDSYCLNNLSMAHYPPKDRYEQFCKKILLKKPEIIILTSLIEKGRVVYTPSDACFKRLLKQNNYELNTTFESNNKNSNYRYELFTNSSSILKNRMQ
jgi:hypothetical protein